MPAYQRKRYQSLNDGPKFMDFVKGKVNTAATNIVGSAANSASASVNNAFKGVKLPDVNVAIAKETKETLFKAVGILAGTAILVAIIIKK